MATNPALRLPLQDWVRRFDFWMSEQSPKASEQLSIIFDFRRVAGKLEAETALDEIMATAVRRRSSSPTSHGGRSTFGRRSGSCAV